MEDVPEQKCGKSNILYDVSHKALANARRQKSHSKIIDALHKTIDAYKVKGISRMAGLL